MIVSSLRRLVWVPFVVLGCSGRTVGVTDKPDVPCDGGTCADSGGSCVPGASKPADDGCNTCSCSGGEWLCTQKACPVPECTDGQTKWADCNSCTCMDGQWACTLLFCPSPVCTDGQTQLAPDGCNRCACMSGHWVCTDKACEGPPAACMPGASKPAGDGCNTCSCFEGQWLCTLKACPVPMCKDGETMPAGDGCNTCACANGQWGCTTKNCQPPPTGEICGGFAGNTCAADEYCAYTVGSLCGAADASATCEKRPTECPPMNAPVCACDGKQYASACAAAVAGFGVNSNGACGS